MLEIFTPASGHLRTVLNGKLLIMISKNFSQHLQHYDIFPCLFKKIIFGQIFSIRGEKNNKDKMSKSLEQRGKYFLKISVLF